MPLKQNASIHDVGLKTEMTDFEPLEVEIQ
jgi:hypothetical protein